ncbi:protein SAWADEE HOMEODOMAIN HOMOLOG 1-like [Dioscorea cayenensis subsp. rotundata]|uniref:Protein SAWADEE HOMEODOMAIN HOMOLOG 1-like n=1 Tax=Dioscorea cayennensis subsp. rotundata TaxID=55577 RepID=A0AB40AL44_DIOCR|nr:protein SAWADEE HOMEODOMAIN HOMOLOG 1-like [Dioscorea cayenensis subsp. rotundata]
MGKPLRNQGRNLTPRFTRSEIKEMEKLLDEQRGELVDESFCQKLTEKFNALGRDESRAIKVKQVQRWFQSRLRIQVMETTPSPVDSKETVVVLESSSDTLKDSDQKVPDILELEFEAKSSRDGAWYDVGTFLAHRVLSSGEPEVRVRFQGFGPEEDEWVHVKRAVRERSIPLESSECHKVEMGDLVLCFQENSDQATYYDAHVLEIQRKQHDIRGCRCLFLIRYDHDRTEERVHHARLCRRPSNRAHNVAEM